MIQSLKNHYRRAPHVWDWIFLAALFAPLYFFLLGNRPFATPDEARYVEIPREMLSTNDWLTPRLNGVKYFEKPPFLYWLLAIVQKYAGMSEGVMRTPIVALGLMGIFGTYAFARKAFDRQTGLLAAFILGTSVLWFVLSRLIVLDMAVSIFVTFALYSFYCGIVLNTNRRLYLALFTIMCGLGMLAKGLMILALPGPIIVIWLTVTNKWSSLKPLYFISNFMGFLLIAVPWHIWVTLKNPEFAHKYFVVEHFLRFTTTIHMRYKPMWFFVPIVFAGFLPWAGMIIPALTSVFKKPKDPLRLFLFIWILFIFVFFSLSKSKLVPYILPIFPPLAILIGLWIRDKILLKNYTHILWSLFSIAILGAIAGFFYPIILNLFGHGDIIFQNIPLMPSIQKLAYAFAALALFTLPILPMPQFLRLTGIMGSIVIAIPYAIIDASPHIQKASLKPLVQHAMTLAKPNDIFACYQNYQQDVPVYANKIITVVNYTGELHFGTTVEDTSRWMVSQEQFAKQLTDLKKGETIWLFMKENSVPTLKAEMPMGHFITLRCQDGFCLVAAKNP